jgi:hypothetical protein
LNPQRGGCHHLPRWHCITTLSLGVAGLGSLRRLGRIGLVTIACFLCLTALSTALGGPGVPQYSKPATTRAGPSRG